MLITRFYYLFKPFIPRSLQIILRRQLVYIRRKQFGHVWPIDPMAGTLPDRWTGWPDQKRFALVLTHDVDTAKGHSKCQHLMNLEKSLGFRSSFNFVPERYEVCKELRDHLTDNGFEVAVHGLKHDGKLYASRRIFQERAIRINRYLKEWNSIGFTSPSMHRNLNWNYILNIEYDQSTFDTDPFEPQPGGTRTIFPFWVQGDGSQQGYVELSYTLPQDFTLFVLMKERSISIWEEKLDWIAKKGGMALLNTHPDYMSFADNGLKKDEYPIEYYEEFLKYVKSAYEGEYWHALPKEVARFQAKSRGGKSSKVASRKAQKTIWIDLDNSPHVPFFNPIINELKNRGYRIVLTARDCAQTCGLADLYNLSYKRIGRHYGKNKALKVVGLITRAYQMMPTILQERPDLAISHGSRSQMFLAWMMRIPFVVIADYEYVRWLPFVTASWMIVPELIPNSSIKLSPDRILKYPGIKEDVYVPDFEPDPKILGELGLRKDDILVTIRPPATEAHYHNPESEKLFAAVIEFLGGNPKLQMVILPRNQRKQTNWIKSNWSEWCATGKIIIPQCVVNGLNLIWHSDLVVSGGGTMNREAAALGVPVYSIFRGKTGAVDTYLAQTGRLTLIKTIEDVRSKIQLIRRFKEKEGNFSDRTALKQIMGSIVEMIE